MRNKILYGLGIIAAALLARNLYMIFMVVPDEAQQGMIFRILFFHAPMAMTAMLGSAIALVASIGFLVTKNFKFDSVAVAATEVGLAFLAANLITGSIWGRIIWGIWWTWDARLTSAFVCTLLYGSYLLLRNGIADPTQRAKISAAFNLFAFADVPIVWFSIRWWRTQHPQPMTLPADMWRALLLNWLFLIILMVVFVLLRLRQEEARRDLDGLRRLAHA
jgi:heme exporter protein C